MRPLIVLLLSLVATARLGWATCNPSTDPDKTDIANAEVVAAANCPCCPCPTNRGCACSHPSYVKCAVQQAESVLQNRHCIGAVKKYESRSICGRPPGSVTCCVTTSNNGLTKCVIKTAATDCLAPITSTACVGAFPFCGEACTTGGCVTTTTTTTTSTSTTTTTAVGCHFPATGQTTCYDSSGNLIPCAGTGQDGELQKGAPLNYTDNGDGTVTDNNTGLVWEKLSQDGSVHDVNNRYTWLDLVAVHVGTLNSTNFAGHNDWRVPNLKELQSILNFGNAPPSVSSAFNNNCAAGCTVLTCSCPGPIGTSSTSWYSGSGGLVECGANCGAYRGGGMYYLHNDGTNSFNPPYTLFAARAVRGSFCLPATGVTTCWDLATPPYYATPCTGTSGQDGDVRSGKPLSYTDNGDGTVTDNNTGLVWEKLSQDGSVHDMNNTYTWDQAFSAHVATLNSTNFAGHNDWRVPNVNELESIADMATVPCFNGPALSAAFNNNCAAGCTVLTCSCTQGSNFCNLSPRGPYWAATTLMSYTLDAWAVDFGNQVGVLDPSGKGAQFYVRAVRGSS